MSPRMSFLGMGNMGKAMSGNLALKANLNEPILLWSRTLSRVYRYSNTVSNTAVAPSASEAVQASDIIWLCLADEAAVMETYNAILGGGDVRGKLFVECSSISPKTSDDLAAKVLNAGGEFVSMAVFGEPSMAAKSLLTLVPAGQAKSVEKLKPYLIGVLGRVVIDYSGEEPSKATLLKSVGNTFIIAMIEALAEGHVLAEKTGLGSANLEKFLAAVFPGPYMIHSRNMISGAYHKGQLIGNVAMVKGIAADVLDLAEKSGAKLPIYEVARKNMDIIEENAGPSGDIGGLYGAVRVLSGLSYKND